MKTVSGSLPTGPSDATRWDVYTILRPQGDGTSSMVAQWDSRYVPVRRDKIRTTVGTEIDALTVTVMTHVQDGPFVGWPTVNGKALNLAAVDGDLDDLEMMVEHHWQWSLGSGSVIIFDGKIGIVKPMSLEIQIEVNSHLDALNGLMPRRVFKSGCGWGYTDSICGVPTPTDEGCLYSITGCQNSARFAGFPFLPPATAANTSAATEDSEKARSALESYFKRRYGRSQVTPISGPIKGVRSGLQTQTSARGLPVPILYGTRRIAGNIFFMPFETVGMAVRRAPSSEYPYGWTAGTTAIAMGLCDTSVGADIGGSGSGLPGNRISWCWRDKRWYPNLEYLRIQSGEWTPDGSEFNSMQGDYDYMPGTLEQGPYGWLGYGNHMMSADYLPARYTGPRYPGTAYIANVAMFVAKNAEENRDIDKTDWLYDKAIPEFAFCMTGYIDPSQGSDFGPGLDTYPTFIIEHYLVNFCGWNRLRIDQPALGVTRAWLTERKWALSVYMAEQKPAKEWLREILDNIACECVWSTDAERGVLKVLPLATDQHDIIVRYALGPDRLLPINGSDLLSVERIPHSETFNATPVEYLDWALDNGPPGVPEILGVDAPDPYPQGIVTGPYGETTVPPNIWERATGADVGQVRWETRLGFYAFGSANAYDTETIEWADPVDYNKTNPPQTRKQDVVKAHCVTKRKQAMELAYYRTRMSLFMRATISLKLPWWYMALEPMDFITVTDPAFGLTNALVRLTSVEESEDGESITCEGITWDHVAFWEPDEGEAFPPSIPVDPPPPPPPPPGLPPILTDQPFNVAYTYVWNGSQWIWTSQTAKFVVGDLAPGDAGSYTLKITDIDLEDNEYLQVRLLWESEQMGAGWSCLVATNEQWNSMFNGSCYQVASDGSVTIPNVWLPSTQGVQVWFDAMRKTTGSGNDSHANGAVSGTATLYKNE